MRAPLFWQNKNSFYETLLSPFSLIYRFITLQREHFTTPTKVSIPVICIGNITLGGTGKTPLVIMLAQALKEQAFKPHILSRGYRGKLKGPLLVDVARHTAKEVGDEPLLLAQVAPTWIAKDKVQGARAAIKAGAEVLLLDDGLQNPNLHKDCSIIVVNGDYGLGNERVFPAGPLRESIKSAFKKSKIIVVMGQDKYDLKNKWKGICSTFQGELQADTDDIQVLKNKPLYAFAGIGYPEKFFNMLYNKGLHIVGQKAFPDHHTFTTKDLDELRLQADQFKAQLVTTAKDLVRLPFKAQKEIKTIRVHAEINQKNTLLNFILKVIDNAKKN
ncbi:MAG: tetraacyldisaccharide 4'-kinase [Caedibacter sp. 37-49]|nr:MAG: tetraacyldisaccharide 4'-kinase [Caedibacter sp. 37-49]